MTRNKVTFLLFIGLFLSLSLFMFSCSKDSPTEPVEQPPASFTIFTTDFEDDTLGELPTRWEVQAGTNIYITEDDYDGNCLLLSGSEDQGIYIPNTAREKDIAIYFDLNIKSGGEHPDYKDPYIYYRGICYFYYSYIHQLCGPEGCIDINLNTWYHCKFKMDWDSSKVKFYLGSTSIPTGSFTHTTGGGWMQDFSLKSGTFLIDNIKIVSEPVDL